MVHHVDGEQLMVKRSQRRTQGKPQRKHPAHEGRNLPWQNQVWTGVP
jgi:hypothetical protein